MLEKALEYAKHVPVFPLTPNTKVPFKGSNGFHDATQDIEQVKQWWSNTPNANIGAIPAVGGFFVLDIDTPGGQHTMEELGIWERLATDDSFQAYVTPSGGFHFWWKTDSKIIMEKTRINLWEDIDILSADRFVIVPPSQTPQGKYFEKLEFSKIPTVPKWLEDMIEKQIKNEGSTKTKSKVFLKTKKNYRKQYTGALLDRVVEGTSEGERNDWLASITGSLLNTGMSMRNAHDFLQIVNQNYVEPSLPAREVDTIFKSIASKFLEERAGQK